MSGTASRYQVGLPYSPGMQVGRYPDMSPLARMATAGASTSNPIVPGAIDGGGLAGDYRGATPAREGGGLAGNPLQALSMLASAPRLYNQVSQLLSPGGTTAPVETLAHEGFHSIGPEAGAPAASQPDTPLLGAPVPAFNTQSHELLHSLPGVDGSVEGGAGAVDDGGLLDGMGGGGFFDGLRGTAFTPGAEASAFEGAMGSGLMGGGFDLVGGLSTIGAGMLGNWVAEQAPYEGNRDPLGSRIGAGLGSTLGGVLLGPAGAFLGAQAGGMIGGQFGPEATVGENWNQVFQAGPGGWQNIGGGADNRGVIDPQFASRYQSALEQLAQTRGYNLSPDAGSQGFAVGYYGPSTHGPVDRGGYFYMPTLDGRGAENPSMFVGRDLGAFQPFAPNTLNPIGWQGGTAFDALVGAGFDDLVARGVYTQPQAPTQAPYSPGATPGPAPVPV